MLKHKTKRIIVVGLLAATALTSCRKEQPVSPKGESHQLMGLKRENGKIHPEALRYFENIKTIIFATRSNEKATFAKEDIDKDPMGSKLNSLNIEDAELRKPLSFFDMPLDEQYEFTDSLVISEAEQMSEKMEFQPNTIKYIAEQNQIIDKVITEHIGDDGFVKNRPDFFATMNKRLHAGAFLPPPPIVGSVKDETDYNVDEATTHRVLINTSRRGDFLLTLPLPGQPWALMNLSNERFKVGHAAILTEKVLPSTADNAKITVEALNPGGVKEKDWWFWRIKSMVMGVQKVEIKWRRGWWRRVNTPVGYPGALADQGLTHLNKPYVYWWEFATAKWAATSRFTCTTLVWWSSKKAYNINLSNWLSPLVSPTDLYLDPNTYVRGHIQ